MYRVRAGIITIIIIIIFIVSLFFNSVVYVARTGENRTDLRMVGGVTVVVVYEIHEFGMTMVSILYINVYP